MTKWREALEEHFAARYGPATGLRKLVIRGIMCADGDRLVSVLGVAPRARREHARELSARTAASPLPASSRGLFRTLTKENRPTMKIFSGIQPTGRQAPRQPDRRLPPVRGHAGAGRGVLLHRRPALDHRRLRPGRPARADVRPRGDAVRDRPRPRPLDRLLPEPRHRARRGGLAALGRDELRTARQDDPVQGQGRPAGVRLRRASSPTRC